MKKSNVTKVRSIMHPIPKGVNKNNWKQKALHFKKMCNLKDDEAIAIYINAEKISNKTVVNKMLKQGAAKERIADQYYEKYWNTMYNYSNKKTFKSWRKII